MQNARPLASRQPEPFGHGINIKGRVNIVNNLRYNGPSGVNDKFVDMRPGRDRKQREEERKGEPKRNNRNEEADWPCDREEDCTALEKERDGARERERETFRRYHKPRFGGWNFPPSDSDSDGFGRLVNSSICKAASLFHLLRLFLGTAASLGLPASFSLLDFLDRVRWRINSRANGRLCAATPISETSRAGAA